MLNDIQQYETVPKPAIENTIFSLFERSALENIYLLYSFIIIHIM